MNNSLNLDLLLGTKERIKIIEKIIYSAKEINVNRTGRELNLSKGLISKYFNILRKQNILERKKDLFFIKESLNTKILKITLNLAKMNIKLFEKYKSIEAAGLYGSATKGLNNENSDLDLWIKIKKINEKEISSLIKELKDKLPNSSPLILDNEKINQIKEKDKSFYNSLFFGSITIYGEENAL